MNAKILVLAAAVLSGLVLAHRKPGFLAELGDKVRTAAESVANGLRGTITVFDADGNPVGGGHWEDADADGVDEVDTSWPAKRAGKCGCAS